MSYGMNSSRVNPYAGKRGGGPGDVIPEGYRKGQIQQFTPEQMDLYRRQFSHVGPQSYLSKLAAGDESLFEQMEAPAFRQFNQLQGDTASRFSGMGTGARHGSGFKQAVNQQTSDFAQDLQARRQSLQQQAIKDLMGLSNDLLGQRPYDQFLVEKPQVQQTGGGWGGAASGAASGAATGAMFGGWGALAGGVIGGGLGYFSGGGAGSSGGGSGGGGGGRVQKFGDAGYNTKSNSSTSQPSYSSGYVGNKTSGAYNLPTFLGR
jgi:hypothetical protein